MNTQWLLSTEGEMLRKDVPQIFVTTDMEQELRDLREEQTRLQKELLAAKDEALALYWERSGPSSARAEGKEIASGTGSAAPM